MKERQMVKGMDRIDIIQKRFELITVARYRDKSRIEKAMKTMARIRKKTKGGKSLTGIIRRWRDTRYASSS